MGDQNDDTHDQAVADLINLYIGRINRNPIYAKNTIAVKLQYAWSDNITQGRANDNNDTLTIGADADYYFMARKIVAADHSVFAMFANRTDVENNTRRENPGSGIYEIDWSLAIGAQALYDLGKLISNTAGHPEWARTDKGRPNSPPFRYSAYKWLMRGANDGLRDRGQETGTIVPYLP